MTGLSYKLARTTAEAKVRLLGSLDEASDVPLTECLAKLRHTHVVLDLAKVATVNSLGYRHWLTFLKDLATDSTFDVVNCPSIMLDYASLVPTLAYASRIASILVHYRCRSCRAESNATYDVDAIPEDKDEFETQLCERCNGVSAPLTSAAEARAALQRRA